MSVLVKVFLQQRKHFHNSSLTLIYSFPHSQRRHSFLLSEINKKRFYSNDECVTSENHKWNEMFSVVSCSEIFKLISIIMTPYLVIFYTQNDFQNDHWFYKSNKLQNFSRFWKCFSCCMLNICLLLSLTSFGCINIMLWLKKGFSTNILEHGMNAVCCFNLHNVSEVILVSQAIINVNY